MILTFYIAQQADLNQVKNKQTQMKCFPENVFNVFVEAQVKPELPSSRNNEKTICNCLKIKP